MSDAIPGLERAASTEGPQGRPRVWPLWLAYGGIWLFQAVYAALLAAVAAALFARSAGRAPEGEELAGALAVLVGRPGVVLLSALAMGLGLVGLSLLAASLSPVPMRERLALGRSAFARRRPVRGYLVATALVIALGLAGTTALRLLFGELSRGLEELDALFAQAPLPSFLGLALLVGILAPLGEELFFRGYLLTRLVERFGRWPAIALSALLFGALHVDPMHAAFAAVLGLGLGWITVESGSVRPAVLAHAANNLLAVAGARLGATEPTGPPGVTLLLAALVLVWLAGMSLRRASSGGAPAPLERAAHSASLPDARSSIRGT